jgi:hypothetical protein
MSIPKVILKSLLCGLVALSLSSCGAPTKEDILTKARNVSTRSELEKALGKPDDIGKLGPVEKWTYKASNGEVVFVIVGDKVTLQATGPSGTKK